MSPFLILLHLAVLAYGLLAGVFLAFSDFIMRSLSRTSGYGGVEAMQVINREVFRWVFMTLFLGMAVMSLGLGSYAVFALNAPGANLVGVAAIIYLVGCFGVTVLRNVPMNEALAGMPHTAQETTAYWVGTYLPRWTYWNTVRALACALASMVLLVGLVRMATGAP